MKIRDGFPCDLDLCGDLKICGDLEINCGVSNTRIVGFSGDSGGSIPNADFDLLLVDGLDAECGGANGAIDGAVWHSGLVAALSDGKNRDEVGSWFCGFVLW